MRISDWSSDVCSSDLILVENYKVGNLARYGLGYDDLKESHPGIIYCSITGFGQTGPYAPRAGYDYLAQGMGGIMSLTDRKSVVEGKSVSVRVDLGGRRILKKKKTHERQSFKQQ